MQQAISTATNCTKNDILCGRNSSRMQQENIKKNIERFLDICVTLNVIKVKGSVLLTVRLGGFLQTIQEGELKHLAFLGVVPICRKNTRSCR